MNHPTRPGDDAGGAQLVSRPAAAGASVWVAGAVVYAVTWRESVLLPVLTFGAVAAIAVLISHFEQTTEKDEK
jgi:hypothetical protein